MHGEYSIIQLSFYFTNINVMWTVLPYQLTTNNNTIKICRPM